MSAMMMSFSHPSSSITSLMRWRNASMPGKCRLRSQISRIRLASMVEVLTYIQERRKDIIQTDLWKRKKNCDRENIFLPGCYSNKKVSFNDRVWVNDYYKYGDGLNLIWNTYLGCVFFFNVTYVRRWARRMVKKKMAYQFTDWFSLLDRDRPRSGMTKHQLVRKGISITSSCIATLKLPLF